LLFNDDLLYIGDTGGGPAGVAPSSIGVMGGNSGTADSTTKAGGELIPFQFQSDRRNFSGPVDILPPPNATALWRGIPGLAPGRFSVHREKQPSLSL